jgi:hypothetical protein
MLPRRARRRPPANNGAQDNQAATNAALQALQQELAALRQASPLGGATTGGGAAASAGGGAAANAAGGGGAPGDGGAVPPPVSAVSLVQWIGLKLDSFEGSGSPVEAADWLTYVEDKMDVFEVVEGDRVRYATQLLKGEAQIWWKGVQTAHAAASGSLTWQVFVRQFERRFYPATFLEKMKIDLQTYRQDKKTVAEYEVGFNKIVCFVPHVANNDIEKASQFRQGLRPSIRHILGALPLVDFRITVEQALGVEMQHLYTGEIKSSGGDQSRGQDDKKGQSGGPAKKGKTQRPHPYRNKSGESSTSTGGGQKNRAVPKLGMGLVCFRCGDAHNVLIASGVADVLFAVMIIRMWCAGRIQMGRLIGS